MKYTKRNLIAAFIVSASLFTTLSHAEKTEMARLAGTVAEPKGNLFKSSAAVVAPLSRIVFYRLPNSRAQSAAGLEVDGHYHTSLQIGAYSELCLSAPANPVISTRLIETVQDIKNDVDTTKTLDLKPGQDTYVRVSDIDNRRATLEIVATAIAKRELVQTNRQIHAVSRVPSALSCNPETAAQVNAEGAGKQIETITLGSDALFEFGKSDVQSIIPYGREELNKLISRLQNRYSNFDNVHIQVVGHADPLGTTAINQRISEVRAQTIQNYMVAGGINPNKISSQGRGARQPVQTNCPREATQESIACNKPNRRVVVGVSVLTR